MGGKTVAGAAEPVVIDRSHLHRARFCAKSHALVELSGVKMNKKWLALTLKFVVSGALIWFLLSKIDVGEATERITDADLGMLLLAILIFLFQLIVCVFRWRAVLTAIGAFLSFVDALKIYYIGIFFNQTLPSSVGGDAVRVYKAYRAGIGLRGAINGVMLERAGTVIALVLVVLAAQPFFLPRVGEEAAGWIAPVAIFLFLGAVAGLALLMVLDRIPVSFHRWRLVRGLAALAADTRRVFLAPGPALRIIGWAAAGHVNLALGVYFIAMSLGLNITLVDCLALIPPVILITTLPISIAGWGVREGAMVAAFSLIGVAAEGALVLSLLFGLLVVATSLPGGVIWLLSSDRRNNMNVPGMEADAIPAPSGESRE